MKESFMKIKLQILIYFVMIILFSQSIINAFENKIIFKVDNNIITSLDVENEMRYLMTLNPNLKNLNKDEIIKISKKSLIKEKIKEIEIRKVFVEPKIDEAFLEKLLKNIYFKIGIEDLEDFKSYLKNNNIDYQNVLKKIEIEALWNELIYAKFSSKIKIDEQKLKTNVEKNLNIKKKSYLMSEIFLEVPSTDEIKKIHEEIKQTIKEKGFENAALKYSVSGTANLGGKLNWIEEASLNNTVRKSIENKKINQITEPIAVPGGFLILKINNIKIVETKKNLEEELKKTLKQIKNNQLTQFSNIYFNKVKKDVQINEL